MIRQAFGKALAVQGKSKLAEIEKGETGGQQSEEHTRHFL
jgi:hypothetical protein